MAVWGRHYSGILNCEVDDNRNAFQEKLKNVTLWDLNIITFTEMRDTLQDLTTSEAFGTDEFPSGL